MPFIPFAIDRGASNSARADGPAVAVLKGLQAKRAIVNQVIDGRLALLEAAARFQAAHRLTVPYLEHAAGGPSPATNTEAACRALIGWVHLELRDRPEHAELLSDRLERELQGILERSASAAAAPLN